MGIHQSAETHDCQVDGPCDAGQGGSAPDGSMAGQGGGGMGGSDAMGGSGGEDGGAGAGGGGMGGTGSDACDPACTDPEPICDEATASCVQCTGDAHCEEHQAGPACVDGACVQCAETQDCIDQSAGAACVENECVQCTDDTHCTDPAASRCDTDTNECVPCQTNPQCAGITEGDTELALCAAGTCVECTRNNTTACGRNAQDEPYVCEVQQGRCSDEQTVEGRGLCQSCVSDAACVAGARCVPERFDGQQLGYVCLWEVGASEGNAPASCVQDGRPYVNERTDVETIEGAEVDVCGLRTTTCKAMRDFSSTDCAGPEDDAACGWSDQDDGLCRRADSTSHLCTVPCSSSRDCKPNHACNTTAQPNYCDLSTDTCYSDTDCAEGQTCTGDNQCMQS